MKNNYYQKVHKNCGGQIVIISSKKDWLFVCKECSQTWALESPVLPSINLPKDFQDYTKRKNK